MSVRVRSPLLNFYFHFQYIIYGKGRIENIVKDSFSINDLSIKIYGHSTNQSSRKRILYLIDQFKTDTSHFGLGKKNTKYERKLKVCPVCSSDFITIVNHRDEKYTCSRSCANKYFQHGIGNPNFDIDKYRDRYTKVSESLKVVREKCKICSNLVRQKIESIVLLNANHWIQFPMRPRRSFLKYLRKISLVVRAKVGNLEMLRAIQRNFLRVY